MSAGSSTPMHLAGLCGRCKHHRVVGNRKGSRFYLCERAKEDPEYARYPSLPVLECRGYEYAGPNPWDAFEAE